MNLLLILQGRSGAWRDSMIDAKEDPTSITDILLGLVLFVVIFYFIYWIGEAINSKLK
jgi:hypothetical protein